MTELTLLIYYTAEEIELWIEKWRKAERPPPPGPEEEEEEESEEENNEEEEQDEEEDLDEEDDDFYAVWDEETYRRLIRRSGLSKLQ